MSRINWIFVLSMGCSTQSDTKRDTTSMAEQHPQTSTDDDRPNAKAWGENDKPSLLGDDFEYTLTALPENGEAKRIPWAGTYWPTYKDSINDRWDGKDSRSPTEKFAEAFERTGLADRISEKYGIESTVGKSCVENTECNTDSGEVCAKRIDSDTGQCTETWFGLCHAWAPAAIEELEPVNEVEYNGVTFKVNDLKALVTLQYTQNLSVKFMSLRCDEKGKGPGGMTFDELGIPEEDACSDTNAGAFHVAITNLIGIREKSLVEDRTYDYEVWNQPIRGYRVTNKQEVNAEEANTLIGVTDGTTEYRFNDDAKSFMKIDLALDYIAESNQETDGNLATKIDNYTHTDNYSYVLELDAAGKIIGGEWIGSSKTNHPDFLWLSTNKPSGELAMKNNQSGTGISWADVSLLLAKSTSQGFDWGEGCEGGEGEFEQEIEKTNLVEIGIIPADKDNVRVELTSDKDVDIQLIDQTTGKEIIAWPNGLLNGPSESCTTYEQVQYCYSGYNGDGSNFGNEWIEIRGTSNRAIQMKAYGYEAGNAKVEYSWEAAADCVDQGEGSFVQAILHEDTVMVGDLPEGKKDIRIDLTSEKDVDIQLYDGDTALVQWPNGQMNGAEEQTMELDGMTITYSGYNGDGNNFGNEYITIKGELPRTLTMKAYGYEAGTANVVYRWGVEW
jgi:hypothetical protein